MGKMLIIAEKPSVAREIGSALGGFRRVEGWLERDDLIISSGIGHLVCVSVPEAATARRGLSSLPLIPHAFSLEVIEKTKAQFTVVKRLMKRADVTSIVNACDAGREGELIFRLIHEAAGNPKPVQRMWVQSMTDAGLQSAFDDRMPASAFDNLGDAARCRTEADWLVGINGTRAVTALVERMAPEAGLMNVGRVQTPTIAILVDHELRIRNFVPQDYWEIHAGFALASGQYLARWVRGPSSSVPAPQGGDEEDEGSGSRFWQEAVAQQIVSKCQGVQPSSVIDECKEARSAPPKLYDLTTLQREANRKFKFSAKKTLDIAQALYETHKVTSYPRTESDALPEDYPDTVRAALEALAAGAYGEAAARVLDHDWIDPKNKRIFNNAKISDHFAIVPLAKVAVGLSDDEMKVYDLIVRRFIAAFHPDAIFNVTKRTTVVAGETFVRKGRVAIQRGWMDVYGGPGEAERKQALCPLVAGEPASNLSMDLKALRTTAPKRYTEDTLLGAMEGAGKQLDDDDMRDVLKAKGLGTSATRAPIIEGILAEVDGQGRRKEPYARREGKEALLVPTDKAMKLIAFCREAGVGELASPEMTGDWELKLRRMEQGDYRRDDFMAEVAQWVSRLVGVIKDKAGDLPTQSLQQLRVPCPGCNAAMLSLPRVFECQANCGVRIFREFFQRDFSDDEMCQLIETGSLDKLDGLISKAKKKFSAGARLGEGGRVELVFEERADPAQDDLPVLPAPCPRCGGQVKIIAGDYARYVCETKDFEVWKVISGRTFADNEIAALLRRGETPVLPGFMSKKAKGKPSKPFSAGLRLSADKSKADLYFNTSK